MVTCKNYPGSLNVKIVTFMVIESNITIIGKSSGIIYKSIDGQVSIAMLNHGWFLEIALDKSQC
jgi:hypothetical protein